MEHERVFRRAVLVTFNKKQESFAHDQSLQKLKRTTKKLFAAYVKLSRGDGYNADSSRSAV